MRSSLVSGKKEWTMAMLMDPFDALSSLQQALDAFRASDWLTSGPSGGGAYPPLNVFRKGTTSRRRGGSGRPEVRPRGRGKGNTHPSRRGEIGGLSGEAEPASSRAACRAVRSRGDLAGRDRRRRRQGRMPRRRARPVPAARRARQAEVDPGGLIRTAPRTRMEDTMTETHELAVRDKKSCLSKEERRFPAGSTSLTPTSTRPTTR